jgi:hypothetical protein
MALLVAVGFFGELFDQDCMVPAHWLIFAEVCSSHMLADLLQAVSNPNSSGSPYDLASFQTIIGSVVTQGFQERRGRSSTETERRQKEWTRVHLSSGTSDFQQNLQRMVLESVSNTDMLRRRVCARCRAYVNADSLREPLLLDWEFPFTKASGLSKEQLELTVGTLLQFTATTYQELASLGTHFSLKVCVQMILLQAWLDMNPTQWGAVLSLQPSAWLTKEPQDAQDLAPETFFQLTRAGLLAARTTASPTFVYTFFWFALQACASVPHTAWLWPQVSFAGQGAKWDTHLWAAKMAAKMADVKVTATSTHDWLAALETMFSHTEDAEDAKGQAALFLKHQGEVAIQAERKFRVYNTEGPGRTQPGPFPWRTASSADDGECLGHGKSYDDSDSKPTPKPIPAMAIPIPIPIPAMRKTLIDCRGTATTLPAAVAETVHKFTQRKGEVFVDTISINPGTGDHVFAACRDGLLHSQVMTNLLLQALSTRHASEMFTVGAPHGVVDGILPPEDPEGLPTDSYFATFPDVTSPWTRVGEPASGLNNLMPSFRCPAEGVWLPAVSELPAISEARRSQRHRVLAELNATNLRTRLEFGKGAGSPSAAADREAPNVIIVLLGGPHTLQTLLEQLMAAATNGADGTDASFENIKVGMVCWRRDPAQSLAARLANAPQEMDLLQRLHQEIVMPVSEVH